MLLSVEYYNYVCPTGPPPSNHTSRYPGVGQPNSYPLGPPVGMGGQPVAPPTGNVMHTSHHPSSNPSTGQSPSFTPVSSSVSSGKVHVHVCIVLMYMSLVCL